MRNKYLFAIIPVIILAILYFKTQKSALQGNFKRVFISKTVTVLDTINLKEPEVADGICTDHNNLWINKRHYIVKYNKDNKREIVIPARYNTQNSPIVNFYVQHDSLYYFQANTRAVTLFNLTDSSQHSFDFNFPSDYFIRLKSNSFIFLESVIGVASTRIHYKNYNTHRDSVNSNVFSKEAGSGMKYSGSWAWSHDQGKYFFVPFYDDNIVCFNQSGNFSFKFKPIDYQDQKLKIIKENNLFYLSPESNFIRPAAFCSRSSLFISSYVRSNNQSKDDFKNNSTIDVYTNSNGKYRYSFYLPKLSGQNASELSLAEDNTLYACYGKRIIHYDLSQYLTNEN